MKKLIFLLLLFTPLIINAQRVYKLDSISVPTGTDTTVYVRMFTDYSWSMQFNYKDFDDTDATIDLGAVSETDSLLFDRLDSSDLPYTMADSTVAFQDDYYPYRYIAIKLTKGSVTAGKKLYYWITKQ